MGYPGLAERLGLVAPERSVLAVLGRSEPEVTRVTEAARKAAQAMALAQPLSGLPFLVLGAGAGTDPAAANRLIDASLARDPRLTQALRAKLMTRIRASDFAGA